MALIHSLLLAAGLVAAAPVDAAPARAAQSARTVEIAAGDDMKFSVTEIRAKRGERLRIVLRSGGTMPKIVMAHNLVVLAPGTDAKAFVDASALARASGFVAPAFAGQLIASTGLAGAGETVEVTFDVPRAPGRYEYVCSFPGHFIAGMRGVLVVK